MVGDLKYRRTVYSLTQALAKYKKTNFFYIDWCSNHAKLY